MGEISSKGNCSIAVSGRGDDGGSRRMGRSDVVA
jgi:hypothetical protein